MNKTFIGKHTLRKLISLLKIDLNKKINYEDQLTEEDVRQIWNDVTGKDIPNILCLQHHHDELYSKLDHTHTTYSDKNHNHDALYSPLTHHHRIFRDFVTFTSDSEGSFSLENQHIYAGTIAIQAKTEGENSTAGTHRASITFHNPSQSGGILYLDNNQLKFIDTSGNKFTLDMTYTPNG